MILRFFYFSLTSLFYTIDTLLGTRIIGAHANILLFAIFNYKFSVASLYFNIINVVILDLLNRNMENFSDKLITYISFIIIFTSTVINIEYIGRCTTNAMITTEFVQCLFTFYNIMTVMTTKYFLNHSEIPPSVILFWISKAILIYQIHNFIKLNNVTF
jgi:hypothetical protein